MLWNFGATRFFLLRVSKISDKKSADWYCRKNLLFRACIRFLTSDILIIPHKIIFIKVKLEWVSELMRHFTADEGTLKKYASKNSLQTDGLRDH